MPIALKRSLGRLGLGGRRPSWSELAAATPPDRDRYVDLLRGLAITGVVLGHWLAAAVTYRDGRLGGVNALTVLPWAHWLTWALQVMPLFFLVGGYANAASWESHCHRDGDWAAWVSRRMHRLLRPTTIFVAVLAAFSVLAKAGGLDPALVGDAVMVAGISLWFLVVYLLVTAIAPMMLAAHRRWGLAVPAVLAGAVGALDVARIGLGIPHVGDVNYLLGWVAVHQLGFAWRDGTLTGTPRLPWALALGGLAALVVLTGPGPYPVSMVGVPGAELQNTDPPSLALLALAAWHAGLALLLRAPVAGWLERPRLWTAVVAVNSVVLTVFLWHMVPVVVGAALLYPTGLMPQPPIGSAAWLGLRVVWIAVLGVLLVLLVALLGRFDRPTLRRSQPRTVRRPGWALPVAAAGVAAVGGGMLWLVLGRFRGIGPADLPVTGLALYLLGLALLHAAGRRATSTSGH